MTPTKLTIRHIGPIREVEIPLEKSVILEGKIKQGKTTILNSIHFLSGGIPKDLIQHGEKEALIRVDYENGFIERTFYVNRNGISTARPVKINLNSINVENPAKFIDASMGEIMKDQDFLNKMKTNEQTQYLAKLLGADTSTIDSEIQELDKVGKSLRKAVKDAGALAKPIKPENVVDVSKLEKERDRITKQNEATQQAYFEQSQKRSALITANATVAAKIQSNKNRLVELKEQHNRILKEADALKKEINNAVEVVIPEEIQPPELISVTPIAEQISEAYKNMKTIAEFDQKEKEYEENEGRKTRLEEIKVKKKALEAQKKENLENLNGSHGIEGLKFTEKGEVLYQNTELDMLSTSQQYDLANKISIKQMKDFGILTIDRAESLGKSIGEYVQRAKDNGTVILASVVGESEVQLGQEADVYVVYDGLVKSKKPSEVQPENIPPQAEEPGVLVENIKELPDDIIELDWTKFLQNLAHDLPVLASWLQLGTVEFSGSKNITISFKPQHEFQCHELNKEENFLRIVEQLHAFTGTKGSVTLYAKNMEIPQKEPMAEEEAPKDTSFEDAAFGDIEYKDVKNTEEFQEEIPDGKETDLDNLTDDDFQW